jgi:hypothetical protein
MAIQDVSFVRLAGAIKSVMQSLAQARGKCIQPKHSLQANRCVEVISHVNTASVLLLTPDYQAGYERFNWSYFCAR